MIHFVNGYKIMTLFYDPEKNILLDGLGNVIYDIFNLITPNQFMLFKNNKETCLIHDITNLFKITLIYNS